MKVLYFADKYHLQDYGRLITGDMYIAMKDGPVPSGAYEIIKYVRGDGIVELGGNIKEAISVEERVTVKPKRLANLDQLSESDVECLDRAIAKYAKMSATRLWEEAHKERAYEQAKKDNNMTLTSIIKSLPNGKDVLEYMNS
jgi:uncharacterized phage-associated protein